LPVGREVSRFSSPIAQPDRKALAAIVRWLVAFPARLQAFFKALKVV